MKLKVEALRSFDHNGSRKIGDKFSETQKTAEQLARKGLVRIIDGDPTKAAGTPSSASPVAPASPQTTVSESEAGEQGSTETQEETQEVASTNKSSNKKNKHRGR